MRSAYAVHYCARANKQATNKQDTQASADKQLVSNAQQQQLARWKSTRRKATRTHLLAHARLAHSLAVLEALELGFCHLALRIRRQVRVVAQDLALHVVEREQLLGGVELLLLACGCQSASVTAACPRHVAGALARCTSGAAVWSKRERRLHGLEVERRRRRVRHHSPVRLQRRRGRGWERGVSRQQRQIERDCSRGAVVVAEEQHVLERRHRRVELHRRTRMHARRHTGTHTRSQRLLARSLARSLAQETSCLFACELVRVCAAAKLVAVCVCEVGNGARATPFDISIEWMDGCSPRARCLRLEQARCLLLLLVAATAHCLGRHSTVAAAVCARAATPCAATTTPTTSTLCLLDAVGICEGRLERQCSFLLIPPISDFVHMIHMLRLNLRFDQLDHLLVRLLLPSACVLEHMRAHCDVAPASTHGHTLLASRRCLDAQSLGHSKRRDSVWRTSSSTATTTATATHARAAMASDRTHSNSINTTPRIASGNCSVYPTSAASASSTTSSSSTMPSTVIYDKQMAWKLHGQRKVRSLVCLHSCLWLFKQLGSLPAVACALAASEQLQSKTQELSSREDHECTFAPKVLLMRSLSDCTASRRLTRTCSHCRPTRRSASHWLSPSPWRTTRNRSSKPILQTLLMQSGHHRAVRQLRHCIRPRRKRARSSSTSCAKNARANMRKTRSSGASVRRTRQWLSSVAHMTSRHDTNNCGSLCATGHGGKDFTRVTAFEPFKLSVGNQVAHSLSIGLSVRQRLTVVSYCFAVVYRSSARALRRQPKCASRSLSAPRVALLMPLTSPQAAALMLLRIVRLEQQSARRKEALPLRGRSRSGLSGRLALARRRHLVLRPRAIRSTTWIRSSSSSLRAAKTRGSGTTHSTTHSHSHSLSLSHLLSFQSLKRAREPRRSRRRPAPRARAARPRAAGRTARRSDVCSSDRAL